MRDADRVQIAMQQVWFSDRSRPPAKAGMANS
jgi:hypothetical protein